MGSANLSISDQEGVCRSISDTPPSHYVLKIEQFSQLTKHNIEKYTSIDFQAGGYKWRLALYPNGNKNKGITDYISLYLVLAETTSLGPGGQIRAIFRLFLLDQNKDNYLTIQDASENGRRFHGMKLEWGFDKFISQAELKDVGNGYVVNDTCVFGAEVYVCQDKLTTGKGECLSMLKDTISYKNTCTFENVSNSSDDACLDSKPFTIAGRPWKIQLYPRGKGTGVGSYLSLYLTLAEPENLPHGTTIYVEFTLRILDQLNRNHYFGTANYWFSASNSTCGWPRFVSHAYFNLSTTGLLVKNACLVEAEVTLKGTTKCL